jgi:hypothetical protein
MLAASLFLRDTSYKLAPVEWFEKVQRYKKNHFDFHLGEILR